MTIWICATCGIEHADTDTAPTVCEICADERQWVPPTGQAWTTQDELGTGHRARIVELEPDLFAIEVTPGFGIGQRGLLLRAQGGNLLWEPSGFMSPDLVEGVRALGGVDVVASSHPHLVGAAVSWSHEFDAPFYVNADDRRWVMRPDEAITLWQDVAEPVDGVRLHQVGGHFPGSSVAHWSAGADGRGVLLTGDSIAVGADRTSVSFMRSYPNLIPLSERHVRRIVSVVEPLAYDRIYGGFGHWIVDSDARRIVSRSAERYVGWLRDEIRDPAERPS